MWQEYRLVKRGRVQVWKIRQDGDFFVTQHGILDGGQQEFRDRPGEKGKAGTKAYLSAEDNCRFNIEREVRKKVENGYREWKDGEWVGEERKEEILWDQPLPKNFCASKPKTSIDETALLKLEAHGRLLLSRKVNGFCHIAAHHQYGWRIYSRRMDDVSQHFPLHLERLREIESFGVGTLLVGEVVVWDKDEKDDFKAVSRFCRSLAPEARKLVSDGEVDEPYFIVFDCLFFNGEDLRDKNYHQRMNLWREELLPLSRFVRPIGLIYSAAATWIALVKEKGWEGLVAIDTSTAPGDKFYSFTGKAERPNCSFKLKPVWTEEVAVIAGSPGQGKRLDGMGAVHTAQRHPATGEWFYCGKVGSGFTEEDLVEIEALAKEKGIDILKKDKEVELLSLNDTAKFTIEIEYRDRQPGTNKFQHPVFMRIRSDKGPEECIAQKLAEEEVDDD